MSRFFLHPGAVRFANRPERIETILGSCVSISLHDPQTAASALCHCVLPDAPLSPAASDRYRFCDTAVEGMLAWFADRNIPAARLQVKLFGGAVVLPGGIRIAPGTSVGAQNAQRAIAVLARFGLTPQARETGGETGRYLIFDTATGGVWIRQLAKEPTA